MTDRVQVRVTGDERYAAFSNGLEIRVACLSIL